MPISVLPVLPPTIKIKCDELSNLNNEKLFSPSLDAGSLKIKGPISSDSRGRSSSLRVWWSPSMSPTTLPQFAWVWEMEEFSLWVSKERQWPHDKSSCLMTQLVTKGLIHKHIYVLRIATLTYDLEEKGHSLVSRHRTSKRDILVSWIHWYCIQTV